MTCVLFPWYDRLLDNDVTHTLLVGGLRDLDDLSTFLSASQTTIATHDFVGCLRAVRIGTTDILALDPRAQTGVSDGCQREESGTACAAGVCQNGG